MIVKLLHYIPTYVPAWNWGGPVRSVSGLCEALAQLGHDVTVFTTNAGLEDDPAILTDRPITRNGVKVCYFPRLRGYGIASPALEQAVAAHAAGYELIHVTAIWQRTGSAACRAAQRARIPYVISPRGALGPYSWRRGRMKKLAYYALRERRNLRHAAGFHYTSQMEAQECEPYRFGRLSCTVPNPIDLEFWRRDAAAGAAWRQQYGIATGERVLLYAGRLHHKKGLELLLPVLHRCADAKVPVVLVLAGLDEDGTGQRMRAQAEAMQARDTVERLKLLPMCPPEELRVAYSGADLFVFPSLHENFGNVAVEAAACGCFVLASTQVGVGRELVDAGCASTVASNPDAWVAAIRQALARPSDKFAVAPPALARFSPAATTEQMLRFYRLVLGHA